MIGVIWVPHPCKLTSHNICCTTYDGTHITYTYICKAYTLCGAARHGTAQATPTPGVMEGGRGVCDAEFGAYTSQSLFLIKSENPFTPPFPHLSTPFTLAFFDPLMLTEINGAVDRQARQGFLSHESRDSIPGSTPGCSTNM
jgi:hypothetical protein